VTSNGPFEAWVAHETGMSFAELDQLKLTASFDIYVSRLEIARRRGAEDPLATISPHGAGGNSRTCTRRMLAQLGYTKAELRVVHRLMAGSASGWPGLITLYAADSPLSAAQREYVHRQVHLVTRRSVPSAVAQRAQGVSSEL
jgi:hypothetical protein